MSESPCSPVHDGWRTMMQEEKVPWMKYFLHEAYVYVTFVTYCHSPTSHSQHRGMQSLTVTLPLQSISYFRQLYRDFSILRLLPTGRRSAVPLSQLSSPCGLTLTMKALHSSKTLVIWTCRQGATTRKISIVPTANWCTQSRTMNWERMELGSGKGVTSQLHNVTGMGEWVIVSDTGTRSDLQKIVGEGLRGVFLKMYNGTRRDKGVGLRTSHSLIFHHDESWRKRAEVNTATLLFTYDQITI
jgi:hypothetical protein